MKKTLFKLLKLGLAILLIATVLQVVISYRIKGKTVNGHDIFTVCNGQKNDVVFLGSSRCTHHFSPNTFKETAGLSAVNLGTIGHGDLPLQILKLTCYLNHNPPPKIVVLNFDLAILPGSLDYKKNIHLLAKHYFSRYAFFLENDNEMITDYFRFNLAEKYVPLYAILRYKMIIDCISMKKGKVWMKKGFLEQSDTWNYKAHVYNPKDAVKFSKTFTEKYDSIKTQMQYFKDFCATKGTKLVCVQSPVCNLVYANSKFNLPGKMCKELSIPFFDFQTSYIPDNPKLFSDPLHMNGEGARTFSKMLCTDTAFLQTITRK